MAHLGIARAAIAQPTPYGKDHGCMLDALRRLGGRGRGSGRFGVAARLEELGLSVAGARIPALVEAVTREAVRRKRRLTDDGFRALAAAG